MSGDVKAVIWLLVIIALIALMKGGLDFSGRTPTSGGGYSSPAAVTKAAPPAAVTPPPAKPAPRPMRTAFHGRLAPHDAAKLASDVSFAEGIECVPAGGYWTTTQQQAIHDIIEARVICRDGSIFHWWADPGIHYSVKRVR